MAKQRVVAYVSFSKGKEAPIEKLRRFFNLYLEDYRDVELMEIYMDVAGKGYSRGAKIAYKQLLADKAAGKFDVVLVPACSHLSRCYVDTYQDVKTLMAEPHPVAVNLMHEHIWINSENGLMALQFHMTVMEQNHYLNQTASKLRKLYKTANQTKGTAS